MLKSASALHVPSLSLSSLGQALCNNAVIGMLVGEVKRQATDREQTGKLATMHTILRETYSATLKAAALVFNRQLARS